MFKGYLSSIRNRNLDFQYYPNHELVKPLIAPGGPQAPPAKAAPRNVIVHQVGSPSYEMEFSPADARCLQLSYHDGEHYNSVRRRGLQTQRAILDPNLEPPLLKGKPPVSHHLSNSKDPQTAAPPPPPQQKKEKEQKKQKTPCKR